MVLKNILKKNKNFIYLIIVLNVLCSCKISNLNNQNKLENKLIIPTPKNQYIIDKQLSNSVLERRTERKYENLPTPYSNVVVIDDAFYLTKIDNIKKKIKEYESKLVVVEGMFGKYYSWDESFKGNIVYKNGPNEYYNDIWGGFFLNDLKNENIEIDDYITVTGHPYIYKTTDSEGTEYEYLFLDVVSIEKNLKNRGSEYVNN